MADNKGHYTYAMPDGDGNAWLAVEVIGGHKVKAIGCVDEDKALSYANGMADTYGATFLICPPESPELKAQHYCLTSVHGIGEGERTMTGLVTKEFWQSEVDWWTELAEWRRGMGWDDDIAQQQITRAKLMVLSYEVAVAP